MVELWVVNLRSVGIHHFLLEGTAQPEWLDRFRKVRTPNRYKPHAPLHGVRTQSWWRTYQSPLPRPKWLNSKQPFGRLTPCSKQDSSVMQPASLPSFRPKFNRTRSSVYHGSSIESPQIMEPCDFSPKGVQTQRRRVFLTTKTAHCEAKRGWWTQGRRL